MGHVSALESLERVLLIAYRQERGEVAHVLLEQIEDRGDPALAEPHSGTHALALELLGAGICGLLEERDTGLTPELLTGKEGRVCAYRNLHPRHHLRGVPVLRERLGIDLLV